LYLAPLLPISKGHRKDQVFFAEQGVKVKRSSLIIVHTNFLSGICYLLNGFQNPARLKYFQLTMRKTC